METPIALHNVAHRVSHHIPAESEMSRQNRATPPPKSRCRTFLRAPLSHFPLIRSSQGVRWAGGGYCGTFGFQKRIALQGGAAATVTPVALLCATKHDIPWEDAQRSNMVFRPSVQIMMDFCGFSRMFIRIRMTS